VALEPYATGRGWTLYAGDCLEVMAQLPGGFAGFVTDPPFTAAGGSTNGRSEGHEADTQFFRFWLSHAFTALRAVCDENACGFVFCDWRTLDDVEIAMSPPGGRQTAPAWGVTQAIVWDRDGMGLGAPFRNGFEMVAFARGPKWDNKLEKNIRNVIRERWSYGAHEHHGAEKPVPLVKRLVDWATRHAPEGVLLDPFAGSGTTGVACLELGRRVVLIERDPGHLETAVRRLRTAEETGAQGGLFVDVSARAAGDGALFPGGG
jgi:DNA modification methylase